VSNSLVRLMKLFAFGLIISLLYRKVPAVKFAIKIVVMVFGVLAVAVHGLILAYRSADELAYLSSQFIQKYVTPLLGLTFEVQGKEYLSTEKPCVFISNHQSTLDALVM
jgi:1-acyl-sn-glycerol-3-phosphate acyltransferase